MNDPLAVENASAFRVRYPESDGEPIGETDEHIGAILYLRMALRLIFTAAQDVYVGANMLLYYVEGDPTRRMAPDVFVVRGVPKHNRRVFKVWEEQRAPSLVIEVTSKGSQVEDLGTKRGLYEMLGVEEYLVFDPLEEYLDPRFQVFELQGKYYRPASLSGDGSYLSRSLGVTFRPEGELLRAIDPVTSKPVPRLEESVEEARNEARRAEAEGRRADDQARRADDQTRRADDQTRRADGQTRRADRLEEQLRKYLSRFGDLDSE